MAKVVRGVDSYKKEFLSILNSLCGRHGRWEVWSDFIQLTAMMVICWRENISAIRIVCLSTPISLRII